jgi:hypothetical protein
MKQYRFDEVYNSGLGAVEDPKGEFVRFEDVKSLITAAREVVRVQREDSRQALESAIYHLERVLQ